MTSPVTFEQQLPLLRPAEAALWSCVDGAVLLLHAVFTTSQQTERLVALRTDLARMSQRVFGDLDDRASIAAYLEREATHYDHDPEPLHRGVPTHLRHQVAAVFRGLSQQIRRGDDRGPGAPCSPPATT